MILKFGNIHFIKLAFTRMFMDPDLDWVPKIHQICRTVPFISNHKCAINNFTIIHAFIFQFLSHVFEKKALELSLQIMDLRKSRNSRLSFEALKYLASLLCHKKFSIEFINMQGLQVSDMKLLFYFLKHSKIWWNIGILIRHE